MRGEAKEVVPDFEGILTIVDMICVPKDPDTSSSDTITSREVLDNLTETIAPATMLVVDTQVQPKPSRQVLTTSNS
ncbi:hypothetical protein RDI58_001164 [Solanum bulbocastanum]|uniref:Uncharacterized protein n=1 Tax=Solanum bulbocastanum TaxID=147425 RepID=A0AAN8UC50_SOLBU